MRALLVVNLILGSFGFLFYGAVLALYLFSDLRLLTNFGFLYPVVAFGAMLTFLSVAGLLGDEDRAQDSLKIQSVILGGFGVLVIGLLLRELPFGIKPGSGFWVPTLGSGFVAYCAYLLVRVFPKATTLKSSRAALLAGMSVFLLEMVVVLS